MKLPLDFFGKQCYLYITIQLSSDRVKHSRKIYGLLDLFGDVGGLLDFLTLFIAIISGPWAEFKFLTKAIEKMYFVKTKRSDLFRSS